MCTDEDMFVNTKLVTLLNKGQKSNDVVEKSLI